MINARLKYSDTALMLSGYARSGVSYTKAQADARYLQSYTETDQVFLAHVAHSITSTNIANWNNAYTFSQLFNISGASNGAVIKFNSTSGKWELGTDNTGSAGGGITTINGDNSSTQNFATGSTGTDFNINTSAATHTFNIPTVSGTARGLVTSALFNTWNAKQNAITTGTTAQYFRGDLSLAAFPTVLSAFTNDLNFITRTGVSGSLPISYNSATGVFSLDTTTNGSGAATKGYSLNLANGKVDKVTGKQLSTEDYTTAEKTKLAGIATGATAETGATIKSKLEALTGTNRLDAAAIKNLPTGGTLYSTTGSNTDGAMTQDATTKALGAKLDTTDFNAKVLAAVPDNDFDDAYVGGNGTTVPFKVLKSDQDALQLYKSDSVHTNPNAYTRQDRLKNKLDSMSLTKQPVSTVLTNTTASYTTAEQSKLAGIATGATANSSDATLLNLANHTGALAASSITQDATHRFVTDAEKSTWNAGGGGSGSGSVTTVSVSTANGFSGTVATASTTPVITLGTSVNGMMKGNGSVASAAVAGTDYALPNASTTGSAASVSGTNVVTNSNLSQMAANTIKGNNTGSTANAADLTVAQARTLLTVNNVDNTSDATKNSATATLTNKTLTRPAYTSQVLTDAATTTLNSTNGTTATWTIGGNRTFAISNAVANTYYQITITQDATGSRTVTWPTIKWKGGTAPTLTTAAGSKDIITLWYDGTSYYGNYGLDYK